MRFGVLAATLTTALALALSLPLAAGAGVLGEGDGDGVPDASDNCIDDFNPEQCDDGHTPGIGNTCDFDANQDGTVSAADVPAFGSAFGSPGPFDANCDGTVSAADVPFFGSRFGMAPGPSCCGP